MHRPSFTANTVRIRHSAINYRHRDHSIAHRKLTDHVPELQSRSERELITPKGPARPGSPPPAHAVSMAKARDAPGVVNRRKLKLAPREARRRLHRSGTERPTGARAGPKGKRSNCSGSRLPPKHYRARQTAGEGGGGATRVGEGAGTAADYPENDK